MKRLSEAEAWQKTQQVRAYIEAVKQAAIQKYGFINTGNELDNWLRWATQQADRLDPLAESPPSILDDWVNYLNRKALTQFPY